MDRWLHSLLRELPHTGDKAVAALRYSLDIPLPVFSIDQRLAQLRNVGGQIGLFHESIRPDRLQQFIFFQQMSVPLDQRQQQVEAFGSERDGPAIAQQKALRRIQAERAEFVDVLCLQAHSRSMNSPRNSHEI